MKTLLITGSEGFIGSHLVKQLEGKYKILCFDKAIGKDIRIFEDLNDVFRKHKIDCVVHLAAFAGVRPSIEQPLLYLENNVKGTMVLLEVMRRYNCRKIVFASSSSVYGNNFSNKASSEIDEKRPISPYAYTKSTVEDMLRLYHDTFSFQSISTRFFTVYGPNQRTDLAISKFIKAIMEGSEIHVYGDGKQSRDYTYVGDIVSGIEKAIEKVLKTEDICESVNLCSNYTVTVNQLIEKISKIIGKKSNIVYEDKKLGDVNITYGDNTKAKKLLNWTPKVSIDEGLERQYLAEVIAKQKKEK